MTPRLLVAGALALAAALPPAASATQPTLTARALLPADATAPAPFAGVPNTDPAPVPGARQPVGGFSALLDAPGRDMFWAMPDNGFGSKANSRSFLLRVYRVHADFETARGGAGDVEIRDAITLRDPDGQVPWPIVTEGSEDRLLTGGDFDVESLRVDRDGDLWFGDEFGPFLLHTDATGKVLEAPIPVPGVSSPDSPLLSGTPNLARSNGFEGMAISLDRRRLYPVLEGPVTGDDPQVRRVHEFDVERGRWTGRTWRYRVADPSFLVSDFTALGAGRFVALERDNFQGTEARHKRGFVVDLQLPGGVLPKREVVDVLALRDPAEISLPGRPGDIGLGDPFSMPYVTIESVLPLGDDRLAIVNDTNFGSTGRNPGRPDDSDFVVVRVPGLDERQAPHPRADDVTLSVIGDTPYGDAQVVQFPALVDAVDGDPAVRRVVHLGDIKNGSSTCTDERFASLRALYDTFDDPFLYTPGDNEWTDCHRPAAGGFVPTERLDKLREVFFGAGQPDRIHVEHQAAPFVENQLWHDAGVVFSLVHVVGSQNGLAPWFGGGETAAQRDERLAEVAARTDAALTWIDRTFDAAQRRRASGVLVGMQADTFAGDPTGFEPILERFEERARAFDGPVLLLQGDTHRYKTDQPLPGAPNVTRIVVEGETASEWLRLEVDSRLPGIFSWTREEL